MDRFKAATLLWLTLATALFACRESQTWPASRGTFTCGKPDHP